MQRLLHNYMRSARLLSTHTKGNALHITGIHKQHAHNGDHHHHKHELTPEDHHHGGKTAEHVPKGGVRGLPDVSTKLLSGEQLVCTDRDPTFDRSTFRVLPNVITKEEEKLLLEELHNPLGRMRYENTHWDNVITGYREMYRSQWSPQNTATLHRIQHLPEVACHTPTHRIHVLDLLPEGVVLPHVDHEKYAGPVVIGLSLMSPTIMQLCRVQGSNADGTGTARHVVDVLLQPRSLYIMQGEARYQYTHSILGGIDHSWMGIPFTKGRRISLIFRDEQ